MNKTDMLYRLERDLTLTKAILIINKVLKILDKEYKTDKLCWQFVDDILPILEQNSKLLKEDFDIIEFEINKEKSARCKNLDEYLNMVFKHE